MSVPDLLADQEARVRAVDPTRSVILQAPAGSGKTTVLIERLLVLLAQAELPEEILAITFTRKAAAEMAVRVAQALNLDTPLARAVRARSQARGWGLAENPNRLRIQTLDALNRALAIQMPLAARGSGALAVLAQPQRAYRNAARRTLLDAQTDATLRADVQVLFERMENDFARCEALIADMLARRTHWLPYLLAESEEQLAMRVQASLLEVVRARLAQAAQVLAGAHLQEGLSLGAAAARHLHTRAAPLGPWSELSRADSAAEAITLTLRQWQALANQALTQEGNWRKRLDVRTGFPPEDPALKRRATDWVAQLASRPGALELLQEILILPDPQLSADETQVLGVIARLLRLAVAELEVVFNELGRVDHPAIAAAARAALGSMEEPSELALRLDNRLRHILVDEFQDTSLEQTQLLVMLTAGWQPGDGRTLFLVGDPMQSIYGFREAEVGMFLNARTAGIGTVPLEALTLRRNFRSAPQVVDWNNAAFARCFAQVDDPRTSSVAFAPSLAARAHSSAGAVRLHRVLPGDFAGEARAIARVIAQLRATEPESTIAVLVSARAHAAPIVAALEGAGIAVVGVELVPLAQLSIVRDLMALTQALDHLGDRTAWLAILRAPWCGLTLKEISRIVGADRRATVWQRLCDPHAHESLDPDAQARLQRLQQTLAISLGETLHTYASGRESLARRAESAWLRLGGPAACRQESDLAHAQAFFAALAQWAAEPDWTGPQDLPERLGRLFAEHQAAQPGAVQIMTIHHAKGLEFDHVILPGLGRQRRGAERQLLKWLDLPRGTRGSDLLMVAVPPASASGPTALGRYVMQLQEQRANNEATRLLYVAATRARLQLHLFGQLEDAAPRSGTLLARLWPAIAAQFPPAPDAAADTAVPQSDVPSAAAERLERLSAGWHLPALPAPPLPVMLPIAGYEAGPIDAGLAASLVEQAACEVLRGCARRHHLPAREAGALEQALTRRLQRLGCAPEALPERLAAGVELLRACLDDARLQWIFASLGAADAEAEVPFALTGMFEGRLTSSRADLSFRDASGTRWLIDIAPQPPAALATAFATRLARHVQLAQALESGVPARAAIYLPATRCFWTGAVS
jgi:ATP-dependent exoDNAse (exonuclease V) beta subunit